MSYCLLFLYLIFHGLSGFILGRSLVKRDKKWIVGGGVIYAFSCFVIVLQIAIIAGKI